MPPSLADSSGIHNVAVCLETSLLDIAILASAAANKQNKSRSHLNTNQYRGTRHDTTLALIVHLYSYLYKNKFPQIHTDNYVTPADVVDFVNLCSSTDV